MKVLKVRLVGQSDERRRIAFPDAPPAAARCCCSADVHGEDSAPGKAVGDLRRQQVALREAPQLDEREIVTEAAAAAAAAAAAEAELAVAVAASEAAEASVGKEEE